MSGLPSLTSGTSQGIREPDSPPPPLDSTRRSSKSFMRKIMRRISGSKTDEQEEDAPLNSSSGSFGAEMRQRQSLLQTLLHNPSSVRSPSAPSSLNSTPNSSPRSSSRTHRPYVQTTLTHSAVSSATLSSPLSSSISKRSGLMKDFYETEDSGTISSQVSVIAWP